jgi:hypothetical protein
MAFRLDLQRNAAVGVPAYYYCGICHPERSEGTVRASVRFDLTRKGKS